MKQIILYLFLAFCFSIPVSAQTPDSVRDRSSFNENWRFQKDDPQDAEGKLAYDKIKNLVRASGNEFVLSSDATKSVRPDGNLGEDVKYTNRDFEDAAWRKLNLPHDWAIEGDFIQELQGETGKRPFVGVGWYRKHFQVSASDQGKQIYIDFDGAMAHPTVWLNGKFVGGWGYGYSSFRLDLTPYLEFGKENVLSVRLENLPESSRWYPGAGIYRNVWLVKTPKIHVGHWGTYITTPEISKDSSNINIKINVQNDSSETANISVKTSVFELDKNDKKSEKAVAVSEKQSSDLEANSTSKTETNLQIKSPKLWSVNAPNRYVAVTEIVQNGKNIDVYETNFGVRKIEFTADKGFLLNGEVVQVKGVCLHHDLGAIGTAFNERAMKRQINIMQEMGANAIRTSHNPPAPELLGLADKMGVLIMDEAFDVWVTPKKENDYHLLFPDWHEKDLRSMIRRDRNHPSIILWSIGNEVYDQDKPDGVKISESLRKIVHEEDLTRPVTTASHLAESGFNGFQKTLDVFGYNYKPKYYAEFRTKNPAIPLIGSETASAISSRGEYFFPAPDKENGGNVMADFQVTSYDFQNSGWAEEFAGQEKNPFVAGEFVWTGFDYLGEPTPYWDLYWLPEISDPALRAKKEKEFKEKGMITVPSRSSYFGIVDMCGFPKDRFYAYQARWRSDLPMAHIFPHWNWADRAGKITPVEVYTSGDEAELFLNGKSLGRKKIEPFQYRLAWNDVIYEPGELKVVAYKNGKKWAQDIVKTTDKSAQISMQADRSKIESDGKDLSFITVKITDKNGLTVPRANNRIEFKISGAGEIVAVDNGDATDLESFQSKNRRAYNGMALVIVRSIKGKKGTIKVSAKSDGLKAAEHKIKSGN